MVCHFKSLLPQNRTQEITHSLNRRKDLKNRLGGVDVFRLGHLEWEMPVTVLKITGYMNFEVQGDGVRASFCWGIMALET